MIDDAEDSTAETDMNVVMLADGGFIEVQGTAEGAPFSQSELSAMLDLARKGAAELVEGDPGCGEGQAKGLPPRRVGHYNKQRPTLDAGIASVQHPRVASRLFWHFGLRLGLGFKV